MHLDCHVVAVMTVDAAVGSEVAGFTTRVAAARMRSRGSFRVEERSRKGVLSDRVGAAEGRVTHQNAAVLHLTLGEAETRVRMRELAFGVWGKT